MEKEQINKSYYAIIPATVRYDKEIVPNAKLLYGELTALSNEKGYCWATNTYFSKLYDKDEKTISRWISSLRERGYIRMEYEKRGFEIIQRRIYIKDKFSSDEKITGRVTKKSQEIIHNNNTKEIDSKESIFNPDGLKKLPKKLISFAEEWNNEKYTLLKKLRSLTNKTALRGDLYCSYLMKGTLGKHCTINRDFLDRNDIPVEWANRKWTKEEIHESFQRFDDMHREGYWPEDKSLLPKNFPDFICNIHGSSFFLKVMFQKPAPIQKIKSLDTEVHKKYEALLKGKLRTEQDRNSLIVQVNQVCKNYRKIKDDIELVAFFDSGARSYFGTMEKFADAHVRFLKDYYKDHLTLFNIGQSWWKFIQHIKDYYHYSFELDAAQRKKMETEREEITEERKRRAERKEAQELEEARLHA